MLDMKTHEITKLTNGKGAYLKARFSPSGDKIVSFGHELDYVGDFNRNLCVCTI